MKIQSLLALTFTTTLALSIVACSSTEEVDQQKRAVTAKVRENHTNVQRILTSSVRKSGNLRAQFAMEEAEKQIRFNLTPDSARIIGETLENSESFKLVVFYDAQGSVSGFGSGLPPNGYLCVTYSVDVPKGTIRPIESACPKRILSNLPEVDLFPVHLN